MSVRAQRPSRDDTHRELHLLWAVPDVLSIWFVILVLGFLPWCGDFGGSCRSPDQEQTQGQDAVRTVLVGALAAGSVFVVAPWNARAGVRLIGGTVTAALTLGAGFGYLAYITYATR